MDPASREDLHGRLSGLVILPGHRMKSEAANLTCHFAGMGEYGWRWKNRPAISRWQGRLSPARSATT